MARTTSRSCCRRTRFRSSVLRNSRKKASAQSWYGRNTAAQDTSIVLGRKWSSIAMFRTTRPSGAQIARERLRTGWRASARDAETISKSRSRRPVLAMSVSTGGSTIAKTVRAGISISGTDQRSVSTRFRETLSGT